MEEREGILAQTFPQMPVSVTPPGLEAIYSACRRLYPDQVNPLQVTAVMKYWRGGPDPLDYISMYANPGDASLNVPPHWHYVSFGLSDLHGDGRVHEGTGENGISGFGFELTMRLKRETGETAPPTWPASLMQALARYVFQSDNTLCCGDHVPWHSPLDGSESRIQHMVMAEDPQLKMIQTPFGSVNFVQIVGVCAEEIKAAQHWNGAGVIELLKSQPVAGGPWLISSMRRGETIFEIDPQLQERVDHGIEAEGSNLSGVSSKCSWEEGEESEQIKAALKKGLSTAKPPLPPIKSDTLDPHDNTHREHSRDNSRKESFDSNGSGDGPTELLRTRVIESINLKFNLEAGQLLPLALRGRLRHGRHFTFKSVMNDVAITLVSTSVVGSIADEQHPFAAHGPWLHILIAEDFIEEMLKDFECLSEPNEIDLPKVFSWPERKLSITVIPEEIPRG
ncbi:suppressor of fused homolog isoform X2 [Lineus longissimus]|uniref:suppressor of fused homolog isoform X2 n=1 Tax=Lineus longissimus TaxID=88925 RepID=UPI00315C831D